MWVACPVVEIELTRALPTLAGLAGHREVQALLTWQGVPCAWHEVPVAGASLYLQGLSEAIVARHFASICARVTREHLLAGRVPAVDSLFDPATVGRFSLQPTAHGPTVSVVLCTRDRPDDLRKCLQALLSLRPEPLEIVVVDNAPSSDASQEVVAEHPRVRYLREPRPGLSWARNRGVLESSGEVVAFTDDDVLVDRGWVGQLQRAFAENAEAAAVTGLIVPAELETESQQLFESASGFGRGYEPKRVHYPLRSGPLPWRAAATGILGSGANMAFRRSAFQQLGLFAVELGAGTRTEGGEDLEMLYRAVKRGMPIVYEPRAFVWHRHRRKPEELVKQIHGWGVGCLACVEHAQRLFPEETGLGRFRTIWLGVLLKRIVGQYLRPGRTPAELPRKEFAGALIARTRYQEARRGASEIERRHGPLGDPAYPVPPGPRPPTVISDDDKVADRQVDLANLEPLLDLEGYGRTRIGVSHRGRQLAVVEIENGGLPISRDHLINRLLQARPAAEWLALVEGTAPADVEASLRRQLAARLLPHGEGGEVAEASNAGDPISIGLVARQGGEGLRATVQRILEVSGRRPRELLVVPELGAGGLPADLSDLPEVRGVTTPAEAGLSAALNAGLRACKHDLIVCSTDDVLPAGDWLEQLLIPFERNDIDIVCGRVMRAAPGTAGGGLTPPEPGQPLDLGTLWFHSRQLLPLPIQPLGTTSNLALRRRVFADPQVQGFETTLGQGVPAAGGEDAYFLYRALRHGYRVRYQPTAITWHQHAGTTKELLRSSFESGIGHVAYHLHLLLQDGEFRALSRLAELPLLPLRRLMGGEQRPGGAAPPALMFAEMLGHLLGPVGLWRSYRRQAGQRRAAERAAS
jgi:O-antigen biosynthesis protein